MISAAEVAVAVLVYIERLDAYCGVRPAPATHAILTVLRPEKLRIRQAKYLLRVTYSNRIASHRVL